MFLGFWLTAWKTPIIEPKFKKFKKNKWVGLGILIDILNSQVLANDLIFILFNLQREKQHFILFE